MDVNIKGVGPAAGSELQVDPTHRAARVSIRPPDGGTQGGSYGFALVSGVMAAGLAAASPIYAFRWPVGNALTAIVRSLRILAGTDVTAFAQGAVIVDLIKATKLPAQYTGGAAITIAGKDGARSSRFYTNPIQIANVATGDVAIAGTATLAAGAPAPTFESNARAVLVGSVGAVPATIVLPQEGLLIDPRDPGRQPEELIAGEGLVIRATVPATGTWRFAVEIGYDAVDPARYFA